MMLQEAMEVPLAVELALLGCYKYALTGLPEPWEPQVSVGARFPLIPS